MGIFRSKMKSNLDDSSRDHSPKIIYVDDFTFDGKYGPITLMKGKVYKIINNNDFYYSGSRLKRSTSYNAKFKGATTDYLEFENVVSFTFDGYDTSTYNDPNPLKVYKDSLSSYNIYEIDESEQTTPLQHYADNSYDVKTYNTRGGKSKKVRKHKKNKKSQKH